MSEESSAGYLAGARDLDRRGALKLLGGGVATLAGAKAADNVLLGYGVVVGTNLREQDLAALARTGFGPAAGHETRVGGVRVGYDGGAVTATAPDGERLAALPVGATDPATAAEHDADLGLSAGPLAELTADLPAARAGAVDFEFHRTDTFFDRVRDADARPFTVGALRSPLFRRVDPGLVRTFAGATPRDPPAVLEGLVAGFREHTSYDYERYLAGSVEDNVLFGSVDLRQHFESDTDFRALLAGEATGLFCYEFAWRSVEALHAVPAHHQSVPLVGTKVVDDRHKHVYTGLASALREDGRLVVPMTFVDYTHATMYDDLALRGVLGEGLEAYGDRHRATAIPWSP